jgi:ABC-type transport system substrate-binding protein
MAPQVLALRADQIDLCAQLSAQTAATFRGNSRFTIFSAPTAAHRMFGMRVDRTPFRDARVRRAVALTLNRPDIIHRDHAQAIQAFARQAGIDISLEVQSVGEYYGGGADYYATTPWINRPATLTEYGARGVPNLYITAAYMSDGIWNASHYSSPAFDAAAKQYLGAAEIAAQRAATTRMAGFLLRDTPVITDYFITYVTAGSSKVKNYVADGTSHVRCAKTFLS